MFSKNFEIFFFYFLFKVFRWERMGFLLFSVGEEWFSRLTRIPSGIFWRCKIDEILISFYPWFSVWYCLFGFLQKFASVILGIMGQTRDTIRTKFTLLSASGATDKVNCSKCEYTCSAMVQRMRDHWESCKGRKREAETDITELSATQTEMKQSFIS